MRSLRPFNAPGQMPMQKLREGLLLHQDLLAFRAFCYVLLELLELMTSQLVVKERGTMAR